MNDLRMESPVGTCLHCSQPVLPSVRLCARCNLRRLGQLCECGHTVTAHDIRSSGSRSACSVSTGARGARCGCTTFAPDQPEDAA
jgi:hypothetical protein